MIWNKREKNIPGGRGRNERGRESNSRKVGEEREAWDLVHGKFRFVPSNKLKLTKQDILLLSSKKVCKPTRALTCSSMFNVTCIQIHFIVTMPSRNQLSQSLPSIPIHLSQRHQGLTSCLGFMVCSLIRKLCEQRIWIKLYKATACKKPTFCHHKASLDERKKMRSDSCHKASLTAPSNYKIIFFSS